MSNNNSSLLGRIIQTACLVSTQKKHSIQYTKVILKTANCEGWQLVFKSNFNIKELQIAIMILVDSRREHKPQMSLKNSKWKWIFIKIFLWLVWLMGMKSRLLWRWKVKMRLLFFWSNSVFFCFLFVLSGVFRKYKHFIIQRQ